MDLVKGILSEAGTSPFTTVSLVLFFTMFAAITVWTYTRPRAVIEAQSRLWEDDEEKDQRT